MNTSQMNIKTSIVLMYFGNPHPGYQIHETPQWFHYRIEQKGQNQADKHWLPKYISYNETTETIIASYWLEQPTNLSVFRNRTLSVPFGR